MHKIPMEHRSIVKRMILEIDGVDTRISVKDVMRRLMRYSGEEKPSPSIVRASYELLHNAVENPPPGFAVHREDEGFEYAAIFRRVHH
jgi:hypothetical protein